ncbi:hypothetical protein LUX09_31315 [Streptomyces albogriseolus]|nr:hypothetical protein [Streptomyces albogriseolus]
MRIAAAVAAGLTLSAGAVTPIAAGGGATVRLITGDRVTVRTDVTGHRTASVTPGEGGGTSSSAPSRRTDTSRSSRPTRPDSSPPDGWTAAVRRDHAHRPGLRPSTRPAPNGAPTTAT